MTILTEKASSGKTWIRSNKIIIFNDLDQTPTITYSVEQAVELDGRTFVNKLTDFSVPFDPAANVPIRNPITGELTGAKITKGEIYALIYSAFWQDATDNGIAAV